MASGWPDAAGETPAQGVRLSAAAGRLPTEEHTPSAGQAGEVSRRSFPWWAWLGALAAVTVVLFLLYERLARTFPVGPDGADQALQAWDILHGNWLLRGWTVTDVSFYTTEIPQYALIEVFRGLGPGVVHIAAAMTYTLLVLAAGLLAKGRATGREGLVRALVAAGIMLAPQLGSAIHLLISQPDHLGTQVPLLVLFIIVDRAPRRWYVPAAVAIMLTWVVIGDRVAVFDAVLPLIAVCGSRAAWAVIRHGRSLASQWFELALTAASLISVGAAAVIVHEIHAVGGYKALPLVAPDTSLQHLPRHLVLAAEGILNIYGADFFHVSPGTIRGPASGTLSPTVGTVIAVVHLVGVALALWALCRALRRFFSTTDLIVPVLAAAIVINTAAYVLSVRPVELWDTREINALLPFGAVLAGRLLAGSLIKARLQPALVVVLACYVAFLGYGAAQPARVDNQQAVIGWLEAHHLRTGLGTYTLANVITLDSGGKVAVRTASWHPSYAVPRAYQSKASWYDARIHYANFVISNSADGNRVSIVPTKDIMKFAGPPARTYHYKTFTIMVWNKNLLSDLKRPPSPYPGNIP